MSPTRSTTSLVRRAREVPFLTAEEESRLARLAAAGDLAAANRLVISHLRVVVNIARSYGRFGLPVQDLIQEGTIGLIHAVQKFDPDRDARLATYAMWWVRAAIQDYVVRSWSLVRVGKTAQHRDLFFNLKRHLASAPGLDTLGEELMATLARRFQVPLADVIAMARRVTGFDLSLDAPAQGAWAASDTGPLVDRLRDERPTPEDAVVENGLAKAWRDWIEGALTKLPAREALIIRDRYLTEAARTLESIGRDLGLSRHRVRQLELAALAKLKLFLQPTIGVDHLTA